MESVGCRPCVNIHGTFEQGNFEGFGVARATQAHESKLDEVVADVGLGHAGEVVDVAQHAFYITGFMELMDILLNFSTTNKRHHISAQLILSFCKWIVMSS